MRRQISQVETCQTQGGNYKGKPKPEPTKPRDGKVEKGERGGKVYNDRAGQAKAKTRTFVDVIKGRKWDESKIVDSVKSRGESEENDSI